MESVKVTETDEEKKIPTKLEECSSLECDVIYSVKISPTFDRNLLNLSTEQMSNTVTMGVRSSSETSV